jgi:hypothetical protein
LPLTVKLAEHHLLGDPVAVEGPLREEARAALRGILEDPGEESERDIKGLPRSPGP